MTVLAAAAWLALAGAAATACPNAPQPRLPTAPLSVETARGVHAFTVEQATTSAQTECGLMRRPRLARDEGMLFRQRRPGPAHFWMKDTPQPLDMLFLDREGRIVHMETFTTPYSTTVYGSNAEIAAVLEVAAGTAARLSAQVGDRVSHAWFK